jgi:RNA polymerase sigma-70 factor, ECF subfamily
LAWLRTITQSRAIDSLRAGRPQRSHVQSDNWEQTLLCSRNSPEQLLVKRRLENELAQQIEALRPEQSLLVRLAFYEGHTHAQIAAITGTPLGTVKTRIRGALQLLRQRLQSQSINKPAFC